MSQPEPNDGLVQVSFSNGADAHPNDMGSVAIASAFLSWHPTP